MDTERKDSTGTPTNSYSASSDDESYIKNIKGKKLNNRYIMQKEIGSGQSASVYLAKDTTQENELVAIKLSRTAAKYVKQMKNERKLHLRIAERTDAESKPFLAVSIDDFTIEHGGKESYCLVFSYVSNTIEDIISLFPDMSLEHAKTYIRNMLVGLHALHTQARLVHSDLKPDNLLVEHDPDDPMTSLCTIADFGLSVNVSGKNNYKIQNRPYRAFEIVIGRRFTPKVDLWSTGCILYELLFGEYLFDISKTHELSADACHLVEMETILGPIPKEIAMSGKYSNKFFNTDGILKHRNHVRKNEGLYSMIRRKYNSAEAKEISEFIAYLLQFESKKRPTAAKALLHNFLQK